MTISPKYSIPGLIVAGIGIVWFFKANLACACLPPEKAWEAAIKSDLRNLRYVEEVYFADSGRYAESLEALGEGYVSTTDVLVVIGAADSVAFTATGAHRQLTDRACRLEVGVTTADSLWCFDR